MGGKVKDITGEKFGRLTVLRLSLRELKPRQAKYWFCECECGVKKDVRGPELRNGNIISCGCYNREKSTKHGLEGSKIYNVWASMKARCQNPKHKAYKNYGERGISVCDRWQEFTNFFDDMGHAPIDHEIDRIDNNGNYEPSNCRWATRTENLNNRRINQNLTYEGETLTLTQWAEKTGLSRTTLGRRVRLGWSAKDILTKPLSRKKPTKN